MASLSANTTLLQLDRSYVASGGIAATYRNLMRGGSVSGADSRRALYAGSLYTSHDAGGRQDGGALSFGTSFASYVFNWTLDCAPLTSVNASIVLKYGMADTGALLKYGIDVFKAGNYIGGHWTSTNGVDLWTREGWVGNLGPGVYTFTFFLFINTDPNLRGGWGEVSYSLRTELV